VNLVHNRSLAVVECERCPPLAYPRHHGGSTARRWSAVPTPPLLIDYPDFNLRLARRLRRAGIPVYYYISPTVWPGATAG
jgi:hypothetical protein